MISHELLVEEDCLALRSTWCVWTRCAKIKSMYTGNTRSRWAVLGGTTTQCTHQIWAYMVGSVVTRRGVVYGHLYSPLSIGFSTQDTAPIIFLVQIWMNLFPFSCVFWIRNHQVHNCASTLMGKNWKVHTVHRGRFNESTSYQHWWWWNCPDSNPWTMCVSWYTCKLIAPRLSCGVAIQQMGSHN